MNPLYLERLIVNFLNEDLGTIGDITSKALPKVKGKAKLIAKESGILCGVEPFSVTFKLLNPETEVKWLKQEGEEFERNEVVCLVEGELPSILSAERTALNLIQKLSGIATTTKNFVKELENSPVRLLDTRKTTPGLRVLEKHATKVGGALNHRMGLYDAAMIKDNHIRAFGGVKPAVIAISKEIPVTTKVEVEVENSKQLKEALEVIELIDIVMLDNWPLEKVEEAVLKLKEAKPSLKVEISGGITLEKLKAVKSLPVDFVSTSKIVTAAKWIDFSLEVE